MTNVGPTVRLSSPAPGIQCVTLHRPEVRNAINIDMMQALLAFWTSCQTDEATRCIILTGTPPAFCAGADLKARQHMSIETWQSQHAVLQKAMRAMVSCPIPILAAVNGAAFGGGLELVLASDFAYAAHSARFAQSETKLGIMPGAMGTQHLPRACGARRAKELTLSGRVFTAEEAYRWGIVNESFPDDELMSQVLQCAQAIASMAPLANRRAKSAINVAFDLPIEKGYQFEIDAYNTLLSTQDRHEGINAFNEKRKSEFEGK